MSSKLTMEFRGSRAEYFDTFRRGYVFDEATGKVTSFDAPGRITAAWVKARCEEYGIERFEVTTERRIYWQRTYEMGQEFGEWKKSQIVGKFPRGGWGVFSSKETWPGY